MKMPPLSVLAGCMIHLTHFSKAAKHMVLRFVGSTDGNHSPSKESLTLNGLLIDSKIDSFSVSSSIFYKNGLIFPVKVE